MTETGEAKFSSEEFRTTVKKFRDAVFLLPTGGLRVGGHENRMGQIIHCSSFGAKKRKRFLGKALLEIFSQTFSDSNYPENYFQRHYQNRNSVSEKIFHMASLQHEKWIWEFYVTISYAPLRDVDGNVFRSNGLLPTDVYRSRKKARGKISCNFSKR